MDLVTQLHGLVNQQITVWLIGSGVECAGTLLSVGNDYIDVQQAGPASDHAPHWLIPLIAISCVAHRA
ncbi:MAG TPA: hypothetical protein VGC41_27095 [Kofleriaceae bacterium]